MSVLSVKNLVTMLRSDDNDYAIVDDVSFDLKAGKTLALLGESGCGKSMTALSLLGLTPQPAVYIKSGEIEFDGQDLLSFSEQDMRSIRGKRISMIFQEPMTSLNPVMTIADQIAEVLLQNGSTASSIDQDVIDILKSVGIPDADQRLKDYPHQFSGGMKQRVMIALALATKPDVLIADEPTTALDVTIQAQVLALIKDMQQKTGMSILLITHDLAVVRNVADDIAIMYAGQIVETAECDTFFKQPMHPYSRALFHAIPNINNRNQNLSVIKGLVPSLQQNFTQCRFSNRCDYSDRVCQKPIKLNLQSDRKIRCVRSLEELENSQQDQLLENQTQSNNSAEVLLEVSHLKTHFPIRKGILKRTNGYVYAVDGIDLNINKGETLALVGESGCGKTTVGKSILNMIKESQGKMKFAGDSLEFNSLKSKKAFYQKAQFIFQDPFSSMNPRMTVKQIMSEGLLSFTNLKGDALEKRIADLLTQVGLDARAMDLYPHEFSGGQRQRISIARAIAVEPEFIVCDEPTSALDVSVQAQILNLLKQLQQQSNLAYLFITHDLSVVSWLADKIAVMYLGKVVELGSVEQILNSPKHPYSKALLASVPTLDGNKDAMSGNISGELPSPINPPAGCYFHPRCPVAMDKCKQSYPDSVENNGHQVSCFLEQ